MYKSFIFEQSLYHFLKNRMFALKNKIISRIVKTFFYAILLPITYLVCSFLFSAITVNSNFDKNIGNKTIYLNSTGVHLDIIIPIDDVSEKLKTDLEFPSSAKFLSFGWGDENFYLNTPTWGDLTFKNAIKAGFLKSPSLIHSKYFLLEEEGWVKVRLGKIKLKKINNYIFDFFDLEKGTKKMISKGYGVNDNFYKAKGSYSIFKTCNTWVNSALKESEMKACFWTPFDFSIIDKYK